MKTEKGLAERAGVLKIFAGNLKRRRLILGWNQEDSASYLGVSRAEYNKYEAAKARPSDEVCVKLVEHFKLPLAQYFRLNESYQLRFFRKLKRQTQRDAALIEQVTIDASRKLKDYAFLEEVTGAKIPEERYFLRDAPKRREDIVQTATKVRGFFKEHGLYDNELLGRVIENLGVKVIEMPFQVSGCFGFTLKLDERRVAIVVNTDKNISRERRLFTLAHELGHILLHSHGPSIEDMDDESAEKSENEANAFAASLLMPEDAFDEEWNMTSGVSWLDRVLAVKQAFRVSYKTVLWHLNERKSHPDAKLSVYAMFGQQYLQRFGKSLAGNVEPFPYSFQNQSLPRYASLCRTAYEKGEISLSRLAELLGISYTQARDLSREWC